MTSHPSHPSPPSIHVLIADDHLVVREGLRAILEAASDLVLVGEAADGAEAVQLAAELSPDVVLMDLRMPNVDGIEAIRRIKARCPDVEIVILTTYDDDEHIVRGLRAGARGYLDTSAGIQPLEIPVADADRGAGDVHPLGNPHFLTDPLEGLRVARLIHRKLVELRPENRAVFDGQLEIGGALELGDGHFDAAVTQIEAVCVPLTAVADNGHLFALQRVYWRVFFIVDLQCHDH